MGDFVSDLFFGLEEEAEEDVLALALVGVVGDMSVRRKLQRGSNAEPSAFKPADVVPEIWLCLMLLLTYALSLLS